MKKKIVKGDYVTFTLLGIAWEQKPNGDWLVIVEDREPRVISENKLKIVKAKTNDTTRRKI